MKIVVITDDALKDELMSGNLADNITVTYSNEPVAAENADCCIDLLFEPAEKRINQLLSSNASLIIVNSVLTTLPSLPSRFVRINGWPTFLKRTIVEASAATEEIKNKTEEVFACFGKKTEWVPDISGFVTARVVSTIINEAYFALEENVSSKEEIDTAMKLGTNYPYGPFEWSAVIGLKKIDALLTLLSTDNSRYMPAARLKKEALLL